MILTLPSSVKVLCCDNRMSFSSQDLNRNEIQTTKFVVIKICTNHMNTKGKSVVLKFIKHYGDIFYSDNDKLIFTN